jgi:hypothetical protein
MNLISDEYSNIVSTNLDNIKLSKEFVDTYNIDNFDQKIIESSIKMENGMSEFQCRHFVANSQLTPWRSVRQCMMELETRYHAYVEIQTSLRKAEVLKKKLSKNYELCEDDLDKEMIKIDMDKNDYDIGIWKRKYKQSYNEMNIFINLIKEYVSTEEDLESLLKCDEQEEQKYWVARLGKQAAMDIVSYGRISTGNMDSIAMLEESDQISTLQIAIKYSGLIGGGIDKIHKSLQPDFEKYLKEQGISAPKLSEHSFTGQKKLLQ